MYQPYRGQRSQHWHFMRNFFVILLCIFIIGCAVFLLFFQERFQGWYAAQKAAISQQQPVADDTDANGGADPIPPANVPAQEAQDPEAEPIAPPATAAAGAKVLEIPSDKIGDVAYLQQVISLYQKGSIGGASLVVKNVDGYIDYPATYAPLQGTTAIRDVSASMQGAVTMLKNTGMPVTAVIYSHQDDLFAKKNLAAAVTNVEKRSWRTGDSKCWLNPAAPETQAYLSVLIGDCKTMGFDEVLLRGLGWPPAGRLDRIVYGDAYATGAARADLLAAQVTALAQSAAPMHISVCLDDATAANGLHEASGQDVRLLYAAAFRVYARMGVQSATSGDSLRTIVAGFTGGESDKITPMYAKADLAPALFAGQKSFYYIPSETKGSIDSYLT